MAVSPRLSQSDLRRVLQYNPLTGEFHWRVGPSQRTKAGELAGSKTAKGYIRIKIKELPYPAHRLAWLYVHGEMPPCVVDHIDGDKANNRIANLRLATPAQNAWNSKRRVNNKSGFKGVSFNTSAIGRPWMATIGANGVKKTIGRYRTKEDAHAAYRSAAASLHGEFARAV